MPLLKTIAGAVVGEAVGRKKGHGLLGAGTWYCRNPDCDAFAARCIGSWRGVLVAKKLYDRRKARKA